MASQQVNAAKLKSTGVNLTNLAAKMKSEMNKLDENIQKQLPLQPERALPWKWQDSWITGHIKKNSMINWQKYCGRVWIWKRYMRSWDWKKKYI